MPIHCGSANILNRHPYTISKRCTSNVRREGMQDCNQSFYIDSDTCTCDLGICSWHCVLQSLNSIFQPGYWLGIGLPVVCQAATHAARGQNAVNSCISGQSNVFLIFGLTIWDDLKLAPKRAKKRISLTLLHYCLPQAELKELVKELVIVSAQ
jgi:hypothetical protein